MIKPRNTIVTLCIYSAAVVAFFREYTPPFLVLNIPRVLVFWLLLGKPSEVSFTRC